MFIVGKSVRIVDPQVAHRVEGENFRDVAAPCARNSGQKKLGWAEVRAALSEHTKSLTAPESSAALHATMLESTRQFEGKALDLCTVARRIAAYSLIRNIVFDLTDKEFDAVRTYLDLRIRRVYLENNFSDDLATRLKEAFAEIAFDRVLRRCIGRRSYSKVESNPDYIGAILGLRAPLGTEGCIETLRTCFAAITGAPSSILACTLFEMLNRDDWRIKIRDEQGNFSVNELTYPSMLAGPNTNAFVKEVLRFWTFPTQVQQIVRRPISFDGISLDVGDRYILSAFDSHRNEAIWSRANEFYPERWLVDANEQGAPARHFSPFGWGNRTCVGVTLGLMQAFLFCRLVTIDFEFLPRELDLASMQIRNGVAAPIEFYGKIIRT